MPSLLLMFFIIGEKIEAQYSDVTSKTRELAGG